MTTENQMFKVGDVVKMKHYSVRMTVEISEPLFCAVVWFDANNQLQRTKISNKLLEFVK